MIIECPECKKEISNKAKLCPSCGIDISKELKQKELEVGFIKKVFYIYLNMITTLLKKGGVIGTLIALILIASPIDFVIKNFEKIKESSYFIPGVIFIIILVVLISITKYKKRQINE